MEPWSAADDRPAYLHDARRSRARLVPALIAALLAAAGGYYYLHYYRGGDVPPAAAPTTAGATPPAKVEAAPDAQPRFELKPRAEEPLPPLENSDSMIGKSITGLVGSKAFERFVIPEGLVRRIVATVDNLPRATAPRRVMPLHRVPGVFAVTGGEDDLRIDAANASRYGPYVRVFASIDAHALVQRYVRTYPLFQRAYEELGYPGKYFNDRLVAAIDDLLAAPALDAPAKIARRPVVYKYSDPDLEARSAGQKIMMRMGKDNALAVKAKLREVRRELIAATGG